MIKKAIWVMPVVLCGMLLGGCKKDSASSNEKKQAIAQVRKSKTKLDELFTYDMLESTVYELEKVIGKPRKKSGKTWEYKVDGCPVTVETAGKKIHSIEVKAGPSCTFDLNQIASTLPEGTQINQLTHGAFASASAGIGGEFMADCLGSCGNAFDPSVYQHWVGPRADQMVNIMLRTELVDDKAIDAAQQWAALMEKEEGEDFVMNAEFNCGKYNREAQQFFKDVPITHVRVGLDLEKDARDIKGPVLQCQPGGKTTQAERAENRKQAQQRKQLVQQKKQGQQHQQPGSTKSENKGLKNIFKIMKSVKREKYVEVNPTD